MNVFCNRDDCKFQLNQLCRTSAISIEQGECTTFALAAEGQSNADSAVFWGHLEIKSAPDDESGQK